MEIKDEAISTFAAATSEDNVSLKEERRDYTFVHLGINAAFASDVNPIFLSTNGAPDGSVAKNKGILVPGLSIQLGPENGPLNVRYKCPAGAPLFMVLSGILDED